MCAFLHNPRVLQNGTCRALLHMSCSSLYILSCAEIWWVWCLFVRLGPTVRLLMVSCALQSAFKQVVLFFSMHAQLLYYCFNWAHAWYFIVHLHYLTSLVVHCAFLIFLYILLLFRKKLPSFRIVLAMPTMHVPLMLTVHAPMCSFMYCGVHATKCYIMRCRSCLSSMRYF